jgi:RNA polymerase sigma-70 factor (ECF subfamily)
MDADKNDALDRTDMERLVAGQEAALNDLMQRHAQRIFHFLCQMIGNEDDANDLAQETFVRVYQHRDSFRLNEKFTTWLFTIAANLGRNHLRWRSRHPTVPLEAESETRGPGLSEVLSASNANPRQAVEALEQAEDVRAAVNRLPEDLREAILLCELEDLSIAEAATALQTTAKAVESRLYRGRHLLRERLKQWL